MASTRHIQQIEFRIKKKQQRNKKEKNINNKSNTEMKMQCDIKMKDIMQHGQCLYECNRFKYIHHTHTHTERPTDENVTNFSL